MQRMPRWRPSLQLTLLLLLTVPAVLPLTAPGYFMDAHDARHSLFFLVELDQAVVDGALWPRWGPDHALGFGYPLWLLYAPLGYYVAELFHLLGATIATAVKLTWAMATFVAAGSMYALGRRWWGRNGGLVAGLLYVYAPYHLLDMYVRAALAEYCALSLLPLALLAFWDLCQRGGRKRLAFAGLSYAAVLLTHNITALLAAPLIGAVVLAALWTHPRSTHKGAVPRGQDDRRQTPPASRTARAILGVAGLAVILALGLSAIYWIPMLAERQYIVQEQWIRATYEYRQHFVYPHQFLSPAWGYGYAVAGPEDQMSFQLGLLPTVLALAASVSIWRPAWRRRAVVALSVAVALLSVWLMTPSSQPLWELVAPLASLIQFPWRLLSVATLALAVLGGSVVLLANGARQQVVPGGILALLIVLASFPFTQPQLQEITPRDQSPTAVIDFELEFPDMRGITVWASRLPQPEDTPLVSQYLAGQPLAKAHILSGEGDVETLRHGGASDELRVSSETGATVQVYTYWFPGWEVRVDGQLVESWPAGPNGLISFDVQPGEHLVQVRMTNNTPARRAAITISAVGLAVLLGLLLWPSTSRLQQPDVASSSSL